MEDFLLFRTNKLLEYYKLDGPYWDENLQQSGYQIKPTKLGLIPKGFNIGLKNITLVIDKDKEVSKIGNIIGIFDETSPDLF